MAGERRVAFTIIQVGCIITIVALAYVLAVSGTRGILTPFEEVAVPLLIFVPALLSAWLWLTGAKHIRLAVILSYIAMSGFILISVANLLFLDVPQIRVVAYMAWIPAIYLWASTMMDGKIVRVSLCSVFGIFVVMSGAFLLGDEAPPLGDPFTNITVHMIFSQAVVIGLLCGMIIYRERHTDAESESEHICMLSMKLHESLEIANSAREEAEKTRAFKSRFLATMSHELRTPLNSIIGFSDAIQHELFGPMNNDRYLDYIGDIKSSANHLRGLVDDILALSQFEAGQMKFSANPFELKLEIEEVVNILGLGARDAGMALETEYEKQDLQAVADVRSFRQIMLNLIANAIKFTPRGGKVVVHVKLKKGGVCIRVEGTGIGISEEHNQDVFNPFAHAADPYLAKEGSTGLGLAIVKALVKGNGGTIEFESEVGIGTTVSLWLPAAEAANF